MQQVCTLPVNATLHWLNNVRGIYLVQLSLLFIGQDGLGQFFRYRPLLPIVWRIVEIYANAEGDDQYNANHS
jgi:hypothetical protein